MLGFASATDPKPATRAQESRGDQVGAGGCRSSDSAAKGTDASVPAREQRGGLVFLRYAVLHRPRREPRSAPRLHVGPHGDPLPARGEASAPPVRAKAELPEPAAAVAPERHPAARGAACRRVHAAPGPPHPHRHPARPLSGCTRPSPRTPQNGCRRLHHVTPLCLSGPRTPRDPRTSGRGRRVASKEAPPERGGWGSRPGEAAEGPGRRPESAARRRWRPFCVGRCSAAAAGSTGSGAGRRVGQGS